MRLGIQFTLPHTSPDQWADEIREMGFRAAVFPVDYTAPVSLIDAYVDAANAADIEIAEVGVWNTPFTPDEKAAAAAKEKCMEQLRLADYVGARCCVNVSGAFGPVWYYCYPENFTETAYRKNVEWIQELLNTVKPERTCFALESMPWMLPSSPEESLRILRDVNNPRFKAHLDICNLVKDPETFVHMDELIDRSFSLLGREIVSLHLKDIIMEEIYTVHITEVIPGRGSMNIPRYLQRIQELGDDDKPVMIEHLPDKASYAEALNYVSSVLNRLLEKGEQI